MSIFNSIHNQPKLINRGVLISSRVEGWLEKMQTKTSGAVYSVLESISQW